MNKLFAAAFAALLLVGGTAQAQTVGETHFMPGTACYSRGAAEKLATAAAESFDAGYAAYKLLSGVGDCGSFAGTATIVETIREVPFVLRGGVTRTFMLSRVRGVASGREMWMYLAITAPST